MHRCVFLEEQLVGTVGKPESLNVLQRLDVVEHHVGGNEVDSQAQSRPPGHHNGEHSQPDGHLQTQSPPFTGFRLSTRAAGTLLFAASFGQLCLV